MTQTSFTNPISGHANKLIDRVINIEARQAFIDSYHDTADSLANIQNFFIELTSKNWSTDAMRVFFRNWRSPGLGAASFCALSFRILKLAEEQHQADQKFLLYNCAARISEISHEDVGIGTTNHQELYEQFATKFSGDDQWKLDKYHMSGLKNSILESRRYRQGGDELSHALIISLPEELYNYAEFSFIAPLFIRWHTDILKLPTKDRKCDLKFIYDHLGTTESRHFSSVVQGFEDYCKFDNIKPDWQILYHSNKALINNLSTSFEKLMLAMHDYPVLQRKDCA